MMKEYPLAKKVYEKLKENGKKVNNSNNKWYNKYLDVFPLSKSGLFDISLNEELLYQDINSLI